MLSALERHTARPRRASSPASLATLISLTGLWGCLHEAPATCAVDGDCFRGERCSSGSCLAFIEVLPSLPPEGELPAEVIEALRDCANGCDLALDERGYPMVIAYGGSTAQAPFRRMRWDGFRWQRHELPSLGTRGTYANEAMLVSSSGDRLWRCGIDQAGALKLWTLDLGGESQVEDVVQGQGQGEQQPNLCALIEGSAGRVVVIFYEGDIARWLQGAAQTRIKAAYKSSAGRWETVLLSEERHVYPVTGEVTTVGTQLFITQGQANNPGVEETRQLILLPSGELLSDQVTALVGRPADPGAVKRTPTGELVMAHLRDEGRPESFSLFLSKQTTTGWASHLLQRGGQSGAFVASLELHPHQRRPGDATVCFTLAINLMSPRSTSCATLRGETLEVKPIQELVGEAVTDVITAMDAEDKLHVIYRPSSGVLTYKVLS